MLIKEQNNSNQSSLLIDPTDFINSLKLIYLAFYTKDYGSFDFLKYLIFE